MLSCLLCLLSLLPPPSLCISLRTHWRGVNRQNNCQHRVRRAVDAKSSQGDSGAMSNARRWRKGRLTCRSTVAQRVCCCMSGRSSLVLALLRILMFFFLRAFLLCLALLDPRPPARVLPSRLLLPLCFASSHLISSHLSSHAPFFSLCLACRALPTGCVDARRSTAVRRWITAARDCSLR